MIDWRRADSRAASHCEPQLVEPLYELFVVYVAKISVIYYVEHAMSSANETSNADLRELNDNATLSLNVLRL